MTRKYSMLPSWRHNKRDIKIEMPGRGNFGILISMVFWIFAILSCDKFNSTNPIRPTYSLKITYQNGFVTVNPEKEMYDSSEIVTLTAIPFGGYKFSNWDPYSINKTINVVMNRDKYFTANFVIEVCSEIDGNKYTSVQIGSQIWMTENFHDTVHIIYAQDYNSWQTANIHKTPAYCYYRDSTGALIKKYGPLYNWYAANQISVSGWHLPDTNEWKTLDSFCLANYSVTGNSGAKALAAKTDWDSSSKVVGTVGNNQSLNNSTGFAAYPAGFRYEMGDGFHSLGFQGVWWSSIRYGYSFSFSFFLSSYLDKHLGRPFPNETGMGVSIRLIKNQ